VGHFTQLDPFPMLRLQRIWLLLLIVR
ncbi:unnamed protein product, partial [Cuscuta campestris]